MEVARALDEILVHVGELYVHVSRHRAAAQGACHDATETVRCLEERLSLAGGAPPPPTSSSPSPAAGTACARPSREQQRAGGVASDGSRVKPDTVISQRLQILHSALGKYAGEHCGATPPVHVAAPTAEEQAFMRAIASSRAAPGEEEGVGSYGALCAAHAAGSEVGKALCAAVGQALQTDDGAATMHASELRAVAALLLDESELLAKHADTAQLERLRARALAHRQKCMDALMPRQPSAAHVPSPTAESRIRAEAERAPLHAASELWWLPRCAFDDAVVTHVAPAADKPSEPIARVQYGSGRELEALCRALLAVQANAMQLSIERCVARVALPLLGQLVATSTSGTAAVYALFRLVHSVLCRSGRRMLVFLARESVPSATVPPET